MFSVITLFNVLLCLLISSAKSDRKISAQLNPDCFILGCKQNDVIVVHVKAEGVNDTLHHLWDFSGKPTLLIALTDKNASLIVDWPSFAYGKENTLRFEPAPTYVYGVMFDKLIEFNDEENTGELNTTNNNSSYLTLWDTKIFHWKVANFTNTSGEATLTIESGFADRAANPMISNPKNGTIRFVVSAYGSGDYSDTLPHLLHSGNASQVDLTLNGLTPKYKSSRFGVQLITVASEISNGSVPQVKERKTMDDEHAPGVFTIAEVLTTTVQSGGCGGYLQWRPVVYDSPSRDMTTSTDSVQYTVMAASDPIAAVRFTLFSSAFGSRLADMEVSTTNITFGITGDGFYKKNQYATWTLLVGYGQPPEEHFSMLVTLVLLIGLGLPAILILTGTVCIVWRRLQRNKDALFLSR